MKVVTFYNGGQFFMRAAGSREEFQGITDDEWEIYQKSILEIPDEEWQRYLKYTYLASQWNHRCAELNDIAVKVRNGVA
jgi:hypothetical protein